LAILQGPHHEVVYTLISFIILTLRVFDILGKQVSTIHQGVLAKGHHRFTWNGKNNQGISLSSGTYFVMAKNNKNVKIQKLLMLK